MRDIKIINNNDSLIYLKQFFNLDDFLQSIKGTYDINPIFYSMNSINGPYEFTHTYSFEEAWNLCYFTMDEGFNNFYSLFQKLKYYVVSNEYKVNNYSVVGYTPSVPRFLKGIPYTMHNYKNEKENKYINIYMNLAYDVMSTIQQIINRGIIVLNLIDYLEKKNYYINFNFFLMCYCGNEEILLIIPLKNQYEKANLKKLYFPLVHPSFCRRLSFRAIEKMPVLNPYWNDNYGFPMPSINCQDFFSKYDNTKKIYISNPSELGIKGLDIYEDFESAIRVINNKYNLFDDEDEILKRKWTRS